jgi:hypothetical protein
VATIGHVPSLATAARELTETLLTPHPCRLAHVALVAKTLTTAGCDDSVVAAGWLHDIGYAASLRHSGLHALDGARRLAVIGWPDRVVGLVAYHTGAEYEADERGLASDLAVIARPRQEDLDFLTWADLTSSPTGAATSIDARISEILRRYQPGDPVHDAVRRSAAYLRKCAMRAIRRLTDEGTLSAEAVSDA